MKTLLLSCILLTACVETNYHPQQAVVASNYWYDANRAVKLEVCNKAVEIVVSQLLPDVDKEEAREYYHWKCMITQKLVI